MPDTRRAIFVFLDGVGLGPPGADNPLSQNALPVFERLAGGNPWTAEAPVISAPTHVFRPVDATLGVEGLPQSGTGQATLFSGVNCAARAGRHFGPFPHSTSRPILEAQSIFARLHERGTFIDALAFANAYPDRFFQHAARRNRWTVTTFAARSAGVRLRTAEDLRTGHALAASITHARWRKELDATITAASEETAAERLAALASQHRFTLFEYFLTDKVGHAQDTDTARIVLLSLDRFFGALLEQLADDTLLIVSSDHGNLEDLGVKTHTRHPVPLVAYGPGAEELARAQSLTDVTPALVDHLEPEPVF